MGVHVNVLNCALRNFPIVKKSTSLFQAVKAMDRYGLDRVLVVDGDLSGILTKWDVAMKLGLPRSLSVSTGRFKVSGFMNSDVKFVSPDASVLDVARVMVKYNIGSVPVVGDHGVEGLVTRWEVLRCSDPLRGLRVSDALKVIPVALKPSDRIVYARKLMVEYDLSYLPVISGDGELMGYITIEEIVRALIDLHDNVEIKYRRKRLETMLVSDYMRYKPLKVSSTTSLLEVYNMMVDKKCRGVVVLSNERVVGIITLKQLVEKIVEKTSVLST
ncbi:MAG: hypothetical protein B6U89_07125 [Desulfurococcales archaeon ex4484_58]|nr:MAG: hypothetical protein B6U89_07125 [Desulfurococcales archaeon ex4484_58]